MPMKSKTQIREKREALEHDLGTNRWHSRAYHRFFDGWTEVPELDEKGRVHIRRVYIGEYYKAELSDKAWKLRKLWYALLLLAAIGFYILAASLDVSGNTVRYAVFPQVLSLFGLIFLVWFYIGRLAAPRILTRGERRDTARNLKTAALIEIWFLGISALCMLIQGILQGEARALWSVAAFLIAGALVYVVWYLEENTDYEWIANPEKDTEGFAIQEESI